MLNTYPRSSVGGRESKAAADSNSGRPPESDSEFSDLELDDIVAIKLRAKTPPWQKVEDSQW